MEQNSVGWLRASIRLKELQYRAARPDMEIKSSAAASITFNIDKCKRMLYKMYSMVNITEKRLTVDHNSCIEMHNEDCWKRKPGITCMNSLWHHDETFTGIINIYIFLQLAHETTSAKIPNTIRATDDTKTTRSRAIERSSEYCFHLSHRGKQTPLLTKNASLQFIVGRPALWFVTSN